MFQRDARRMKKKVLATMAMAICLSTPSFAWAAGFGGYFDYSHAWTNVGFDLSDVEFDSNRFGFGFLFDSNVTRDQLFNYRLQVGYQFSDVSLEPDSSSRSLDGDANGFALVNSFGFKLFRNSDVRLWAGPSVRLTLDVIDLDDSEDVGFLNIGIGAGPQVGVNWHLGDSLTLTGSLSYNYLAAFSHLDSDFDDDDALGDEHVIAVNIGLLFHTASERHAR